jgi:hypothetical protein
VANYFPAPTPIIVKRLSVVSGFLLSWVLCLVLSETSAYSQCAPQVPAAPTGLTITTGSPSTPPPPTQAVSGKCGALYLAWEDASDNEDGFTLERLVNGSVAGTFPLKSNTSFFTDSAVITGNAYCYRVRAYNSTGPSALSNQICATAEYPLTNVTVAAPPTVTPGAIVNVSWNGIVTPVSTDWIGLYGSGSTDNELIDWIYVSCSTAAGTARASGSCPYTLPSTLAAGNYELRLFVRDIYFRVGATNSVTVQ